MDEIDFVFYRDVQTLEKIASHRIALMVWRNEIINYSLERKFPSSNDVVKKFNIEFNSLVPPRLREMIDQRITGIREELENWAAITYHRYLCSEDSSKRADTWIKYFDELVWSGEDFSIDGPNTGLNLLLSDRFSRKEKFAIACFYCLENHINDLWADDLYEDNGQHWLLRYWNKRMKNQSCRENNSNAFDEDEMMEKGPLNPWIIEHFWPYLSSTSELQIILRFTWLEDSSYSYLRYILPKLSETVWQHISSQDAKEILRNLFMNEKCRSLVVPFWNRVKHSFRAHQFLYMMDWMVQCFLRDLRPYHPSRRMNEDEISLTLQIWKCAPQQLKQPNKQVIRWASGFNYHAYYITTEIERNGTEPYRDVRLLKMVLSEASPEQRNRLWRTSWLSFCTRVKKSDMRELIELCLPDSSERMQFKLQNMMKFDQIKNYCFSLLHHMEFDKFNDFLEICSADRDGVIEFKSRVLKSCLSEIYVGRRKLKFERIDKVEKTTVGCFPGPERTVLFKREFLSSVEYSDRLVALLQDGEFSMIKSAVIACLRNEQDRLEWKEQFKNRCRRCLTTLSFAMFDSSQWQDFMMWYLGDEEKVTEFKRSLNLDEVLDLFLQRCETKSVSRGFHKTLDEFLNWCLDSKARVAALKRKYVKANPGNEEIHGVLFGKKRRC